MNWKKATYPAKGATNGGYLIAYSTEMPELISSPNGKAINKILLKGTVAPTPSAVLQTDEPATNTTINNLQPETEYNLMLVPYTWDGMNDSTYNYFTQGIKRKKVTTLAANYTVYPNPSSGSFTLKVKTNPAEIVSVVVSDMLGKIVYKTEAKGIQIFNFGKSFSAGIYVVKAIKNSGNETIKILKTQQ